MFGRKIIGIHIENNRMAVVCVTRSLNRIRVVADTVYALDPDIPVTDKLPIIRDVVDDFMKRHRMMPDDVFIAIPQDLAMFREIEFPLAVKENLRSTLKYEMEKHIPVPVEELYYDYQIMSENRSTGKLRILLLVVKKKDVQPYIEYATGFAGGISGMEPTGTALANCLMYLAKNSADLLRELPQFLESVPEAEAFAGDLAKQDIRPELAGAFGLAIKGLGLGRVTVNFLPPDLRKKPGKLGRYIMIGLAGAVILAALAWGGSYILNQRIKLKQLDKELAQLRSEIQSIHQIQSEFPQLEQRIRLLKQIERQQSPVLDALRELSQIMPKSAWLRDFVYTGDKIQLEGTAQSASELIPLLEASPMFQNVHFLSAITKNQEGKENFRIELQIKGVAE